MVAVKNKHTYNGEWRMDPVNEQKAIDKHAELSKLFKEDSEKFEALRKELIEEVIRSAPPAQQLKLRLLQAKWDNAMKKAGTPENRFAMAQGIFWKNFFDSWKPTIDQLNFELNGKEPNNK